MAAKPKVEPKGQSYGVHVFTPETGTIIVYVVAESGDEAVALATDGIDNASVRGVSPGVEGDA